jgi:protein TonB
MDGGPYRPGNDVTMPIEIRKGLAQYTTDAMRARIQGSITVQCVVQINGACTNIQVMRSFDPAFGLDQEAIKAAGQWRFRPGTRRGEPVPVLVTMEIAFALR